MQAALMDAARDGRRSTIAVAHRLSTSQHTDTIFDIHAGRIVEVEINAAILGQRGIYFEMCKGQVFDAAA